MGEGASIGGAGAASAGDADGIAVGVAHVAADGAFIAADDMFCRLSGYPREHLLAHRYRDLLGGDSGDAHSGTVSDIAQGECVIAKPSRERVSVRVDTVPIHDAQGNIVSRIVVWQPSVGATAPQIAPARANGLVRLVRHLLEREQQASHRIAKGLHDQLGQALAAIRLNLDLVAMESSAGDANGVRDELRRIGALLDQAIQGVRQLTAELWPPLLAEFGICAALEHAIKQRTQGSDHPNIRLVASGTTARLRWPSEVEYGAFSIVREALDSGLFRARGGRIRIVVDGDAQTLDVAVIDDGNGGQARRASDLDADLTVVAMHERAGAMGARLEIGTDDGAMRVALRWYRRTA